MKNVSSLKPTKNESPKTPGGISKSLLTPCRRIGLSRNWKKAGPSPFISPVTAVNSSSVEVKVEKKLTRKRKEHLEEENQDEASVLAPRIDVEKEATVDTYKSKGLETSAQTNYELIRDTDKSEGLETYAKINDELISTPSRHIALPRRKKSKIVSEMKSKKNDQDEEKQVQYSKELASDEKDAVRSNLVDAVEPVQTAVRSKSISKTKPPPMKLPLESLKIDLKLENTSPISNVTKKDPLNKENAEQNVGKPKAISPKELTKECMVVIHKKMFKIDKKDSKQPTETSENPKRLMETCLESQVIFDSLDEVPLSKINEIENIEKQKDESNNIITIEDDDDFAEESRLPIKRLEHKNTSTTGLKGKNKLKKTSNKLKTCSMGKIAPKASSQSSNSFDDDEDFFESKKTILIRKAYDKVTKPLKAKSTGSITQKDIDDLRARIEIKKKLLLSKTITGDTEELRSLIKKWQRGCQEALMELMDLMKVKCPEKQNMDYSEILKTLQIPAELVGYDSDNDCFNTPDDSSIVLSKFNNF